MKTAIELREEIQKTREETLTILSELKEKVKELYKEKTESDECPEGNIYLTQGFVHNYIDDQSNEVICAISTDRDDCLIDTNYDTREIGFEEVSTYGLIYIVEELENMIKTPDIIEIY